MGLGDACMDSGLARVAQQKDPRRVRIMHAKKVPWSPVWENNPRIAKPDEKGDLQLVYGRSLATNMRGYHTAKTPERWSYNLDFRPDVGELYFTDAERALGARYPGKVILEPHIKAGASPNKRWPWVSWNKLAWHMQRDGMLVTQLGPHGTQLLDGAELIVTSTFRLAAAVLAGARAAVLPEGGTHHCAAALGVPAVVIFGGFTPVELTGYPVHKNLGASLGEACGSRLPCPHCAEWMARITPGQVFDELRSLLRAA